MSHALPPLLPCILNRSFQHLTQMTHAPPRCTQMTPYVPQKWPTPDSKHFSVVLQVEISSSKHKFQLSGLQSLVIYLEFYCIWSHGNKKMSTHFLLYFLRSTNTKVAHNVIVKSKEKINWKISYAFAFRTFYGSNFYYSFRSTSPIQSEVFCSL